MFPPALHPFRFRRRLPTYYLGKSGGEVTIYKADTRDVYLYYDEEVPSAFKEFNVTNPPSQRILVWSNDNHTKG